MDFRQKVTEDELVGNGNSLTGPSGSRSSQIIDSQRLNGWMDLMSFASFYERC
jgi:hypothetical protein